MSELIAFASRGGEFKTYYENGQIWKREFYRNKKWEGKFKIWHSNGQLKVREFYRDGKREGEYKEWHGNGQLWILAFYQNGKREGERKIWYENGQLYEQLFYRNDKLIDEHFTRGKKRVFLRLAKHYRKYNISLADTVLISDLVKIAVQFC